MVSFLLCSVLYNKKNYKKNRGLHSIGCTWSLLVITSISGTDISKDYALFYPEEKRPGGRTVAISLEKNAESSKFRKKAKIIILISSIGWSVLVSA